MRWREFAAQLEEQPGFRETFLAQFPYANVALAVVTLRERHRLTQRALAELVGTPQSVIARLEGGRHSVEIKLLNRIADAVGERWTVSFGGPVVSEPADTAAEIMGGLRILKEDPSGLRPINGRSLGRTGGRRHASAEAPMTWTSDELFEALKRYERECEAAGLRPISVNSYVEYSRRFLRWRVGDYRPRDASGPARRPSRGPATTEDLMVDVDAYERELRAGSLQPNAVHTYVIHSLQFIRWLDGDFVPGGRLESRGRRS